MTSFTDFYINEVTAEEKYLKQYTGRLDRQLFDKAVTLDPTSIDGTKVGKYTDWIIKNKLFDTQPEDIKTLLGKFEKYKEKLDPSKRDINRLKYDDLQRLMDDADEKGLTISKKEKVDAAKSQAEKESKLVYQDNQYIVIVPKTKFASRYFGAGADWCTARQEDSYCMFDSYNRTGDLYIVKDKSTGEKWQLYLSDKKDKSEYKTAKNRDFDPFTEFKDDEDFIAWLEKYKFPNSSILTDEQANDLASDVLSYIDYEPDETWNDALDIVANYYLGFNEYGYGDREGGNLYQEIKQNDSDAEYNFVAGLEALQDKYFIDKNNNHNKLLLLPYFGSDIAYEVNKEYDPFDEEGIHKFGWIYLYDESISDMAERFNSKNSEGINWDYLEKYLSHNYHKNYNKFEAFYDEFVKEYVERGGTLTDQDKQELKNLITKVEKVEYGKAGHPKLDLQALKYLQKYIN